MKKLVTQAAVRTKTVMRDVVALASDPTVDKVSGFNFRSEEEVLKFIDELDKQVDEDARRLKKLERLFSTVESSDGFTITINRDAPKGRKVKTGDGQMIEPISIKNIKQVESNFEIIQNLTKRLDVLDTIEGQFEDAFGGTRNKIGPAIRAAKKEYEVQLRKALTVLKKIAKAHEPTEFAELLTEVMNAFYAQMEGKFDSADQYVYVTNKKVDVPGADGSLLVFSHYIEFNGLQNDSQDYVYPQYFIVFTAVINSAGLMRTYVNTHHKFKAPGTVRPGYQFKTAKEGVAKLSGLLAADEFVDLLEREPIPMKDGEIDLTRFSTRNVIEDLKIDGDKIVVSFTKAVKKSMVKDVAERVLVDMHRLLAGKTNSNIKYKLKLTTEKRYAMEFLLVMPTESDPSDLTPAKIDRLKEEFGFEDSDIRAVKLMLRRGYMAKEPVTKTDDTKTEPKSGADKSWDQPIRKPIFVPKPISKKELKELEDDDE